MNDITNQSADLSDSLHDLLSQHGITENCSLVEKLVNTSLNLGLDHTSKLDLKIASGALAEMRAAFRLFAPFVGVPKVTIFGSARTPQSDLPYQHAKAAAAELAKRGWMVVTGAGPGIMQAATEGAGSDSSLGVSIRLPFEEQPNPSISASRNVAMKYFFTRKLMLIKESSGFICAPGGFGTLDEFFELVTLQQTGKAEPTPIVLLDEPNGTFWSGFHEFMSAHLGRSEMISPDDFGRVVITDSIKTAADAVTDFWRNYDSLRWVGNRLVLRMRAEPTDAEVEQFNEEFSHMLFQGNFVKRGPLKPEIKDHDRLDRHRLVGTLDPFKVGSLYQLIHAINAFPSAPTELRVPQDD